MAEGYIKLHRQLLDSYQFSNPNNLKIWIWMLLKANYTNKVVSIKVSQGYTDVLVLRGQFVFGRHKAAIELNLDDNMIYRALKRFEKDGTISVKSNNQYSMITICKYDEYNKKDEKDEQPVNSQRTASEQPVGTTKKEKKEKNLSYVKENFLELFKEWIEYKKERKESYKTDRSLMLAYERLITFSKGDLLIATKIINDAMASNYAGFFEPKQLNLLNEPNQPQILKSTPVIDHTSIKFR